MKHVYEIINFLCATLSKVRRCRKYFYKEIHASMHMKYKMLSLKLDVIRTTHQPHSHDEIVEVLVIMILKVQIIRSLALGLTR